jgi:O-antigen ligase
MALRRLEVPPLLTGDRLPRAALVVATLAVVIALYDRPLVLAPLALALLALLAMSLRRALVVVFVILALPLEISKELFPFLETSASATSPTLRVSVIDFARLAVAAGAGLWLVTARPDWTKDFPRSGLYLPIVLLAALYVLSLSYTLDAAGGAREVIRLITNAALMVLIALYVRDRASLRWAVVALIASGLALALLGIFQEAVGTYFWNDELAASGRRNATFADPNNYARFLNVAMVMALALVPVSGARARYVLIPTLLLGAGALVFTSSRSGWLVAATVLPLVVLFLPMPLSAKLRLLIGGGLAFVALLVAIPSVQSTFFDRLDTLENLRSIGPRYYLIQAGWQMFLDHPLYGLGLDSFREAMEGDYSSFIWTGRKTVLSHTSVITVMAELGILGLTVLALLLYRWAKTCWRLYAGAGRSDQALAVGLAASFAVVFLASQSEARFFEDPYLWLVMGLAVALENIRRREAAAAGEANPAGGCR